MEYSALTIGLTDELFSNIQTLLTSNLRFTPSLTVQDASRLLIQQVFHLLVVDLEYLRSILQVDWLPSVRRVTFVPIVVNTSWCGYMYFKQTSAIPDCGHNTFPVAALHRVQSFQQSRKRRSSFFPSRRHFY